MSEHVSLEIADLLAGRLVPEREREVMRHVESCSDCAAEVAFARQFVESALAQGIAHLTPRQVTALADDARVATSGERSHLETCDACRAEVEWARGAKDASPATTALPSAQPAPRVVRLRPRVWISAAAAMAAVVAIVFLVQAPPRRESPSNADLIIAAPLPVRIPRSTAPADSFEIARLRGLEAYGDGDYAAARGRFDDAMALRPEDPEVLLYAGSARLLTGEAKDAASLLERGLRNADTEALRAELSWQLADARLEMGDVGAARPLLEALAREGGVYAEAARRVLERLR